MDVIFLRHGLTRWNTLKKLQGRTDIELSDLGIAQVKKWNAPPDPIVWYVSPLKRALQTARLLGINDYKVRDEIIEMNWGDWEGTSIADLRIINPTKMREKEAQGLNLLPPNGESPYHVRVRLSNWLESIDTQKSIGVITHKGIIRAALSLAYNWDFKTKPPVRIANDHAYLFQLKSGKLEFIKEISLIS